MVKEATFDLVVIGAGPGGYVAAIRGAQLGLKVAIVEATHLGGICLNWGCIPTKALLRSAEVMHLVQHADQFGIKVDGKVSCSLKDVVKRSRKVAEQLSSGIAHLMKKNKVEVFDGFGTLVGENQVNVSVKDKRVAKLTAKNIILATGARARVLPTIEPDGEHIVTYKQAMIPETMPKKLLVVGSGAIGIEFASFYTQMGVDVTVVEVADRVLPVEDAEVSAIAQKSFESQGMTIKTGTVVEEAKVTKKSVKVTLKKGDKTEKIEVDRVITAVGIVPNVENIGLESSNVQLDTRGFIKTDHYLETDEPGVYAIGDVTEGPWLAHKASHEAVIAVDKIAGLKPHPLKRSNIPGCTYCMPQIASVGLTEEKAKEAGHDIKVGRFPYLANGKAIALGDTEGLIKTIFDAKTGKLLGAHLVGAEVTELINGFLVGKTMEATEEDFMHTIFPHPTLSEMMHESVLDAFDKALHI